MAYTITTLLNDVGTTIHGTTINKVPNIYGIINRAARSLLLDIDPKETQRIVEMPQVFNSVYDYPVPVDFKGDRIIDLRPQAGRLPVDIFVQDYALNFDRTKILANSNQMYVQHNTGVKTIRIEAPTLTSPIVFSGTDTLTGWSATSGASNISLDTLNNVAGGGDIQFNLDAGSATGSIQITTLNPIDFSTYENIAYNFYWVYLPTASSITSLTFRWGTDVTANYWTYTSTTTQQGTVFQNGWNLISVPWQSSTVVGTPDSSAITSIQLLVAYDSTLQTGVKFCNPVSALGYIFEIQYYSKYLFRNASTNAFQETVTDATDNNVIVNLDTESYNLLFAKTAFFVAQSLQGADSTYDADFWQTEYINALDKYKALNPNEAIKKSEPYYRLPRKGWNKFNPSVWRR